MAELTARKKREQAIRYLSETIPRLESLMVGYASFRKTAFAIEGFRDALQEALALQNLPLWHHCSQGTLNVFQRNVEHSFTRTGELKVREIDVQVPYAKLGGFRMFEPAARPFDMALNNIRMGLARTLEEIQSRPDVAMWPDAYRHEFLKSYNRTRGDLMRLADRVRDLQEFLGSSAIPTLKRWGSRSDATMPMHVERQGKALWVGKDEFNRMKVDISPSALETVPDFAEIDPGVEFA